MIDVPPQQPQGATQQFPHRAAIQSRSGSPATVYDAIPHFSKDHRCQLGNSHAWVTSEAGNGEVCHNLFQSIQEDQVSLHCSQMHHSAINTAAHRATVNFTPMLQPDCKFIIFQLKRDLSFKTLSSHVDQLASSFIRSHWLHV